LPTFPIASESRQNLADLKLAVLKMMETASGVSSKEIYEKLDFVITDQTAHNKGVEELISESQITHLDIYFAIFILYLCSIGLSQNSGMRLKM